MGTFRLFKASLSLPFVLRSVTIILAVSIAEDSIDASGLQPGDEISRHHLQYLAERGIINLPVTSGAMTSDNLSNALENVAPSSLDAASYRSYNHLKSLVGNRTEAIVYLSGGSYREALPSFSTDSRVKGEFRATVQRDSSAAAGQLVVSAIQSPSDGKRYRLDGTQLVAKVGNWNLGAGWVDRWWGPGWQNSLILGHAARPTPGLFIQRNITKTSELPVIKWLGPWHLEAFANQLESDRTIPKAKLLGMRVAIKPTNALELGFSRTAQWGGDGRPEDLDSLFNLIIGNDNRGQGGIDLDASNEPGNQLGGIDWRYTFGQSVTPISVYGQLIGEDEAGGLPSREIGLFGLEVPFVSDQWHSRLFLEFSDTTMRFLDNGLPNGAYEHSIYRSGYRYYGLPIGASTDNDSRTLTLGLLFAMPQQRVFSAQLIQATLNWDGSTAGNRVSPQRAETFIAKIEFQTPIIDNLDFKISGQYLEEPIGLGIYRLDSSLRGGIEFRF